MSRVFEAEDETLGRRVALKILHRHYSLDRARMAQFQNEALIAARVTHPNVIKLYSVGYDQGYFYIAMELVTGGSLEQRIKRDGLVPDGEAMFFAVGVLGAVSSFSHAHRMGRVQMPIDELAQLVGEWVMQALTGRAAAPATDRGEAAPR